VRPGWSSGNEFGYDRESGTFDGKPVEVLNVDLSCLYDEAVLLVIRMVMTEALAGGGPRFAGLRQVGENLLVVGEGEFSTTFLRVCWDCKWLSKAHRPDCAWKAVRDVSRL
jgi:hypothetical protein